MTTSTDDTVTVSPCDTCGQDFESDSSDTETTVCGECEAKPRARTYVIGLPVVLTVMPDGSVTAEVDLSEASDLWDASTPDGQDDSTTTVEADTATVEAAVEARRVTVTA